jgi:site-specific DNA recombinase
MMRGRKTQIAALENSRTTVGYVRVSTDDQAREGVSLAAQQARIEAFAVATGRVLDEVVVDAGESAKTLERPGMARILAGVRSGRIEAVIALKLDRLTRSVRDLGDMLDLFARNDAAIVSVSESLDTQSASGRLVVSMLGAVAAWEQEANAERTAMALTHLRAKRRAYGPTPFGWTRVGKSLRPNDEQQMILVTCKDLHAAGTGLSYRMIAERLNESLVPAPRGGRWFPASVRQVLTSKMSFETLNAEAV